MTTARPDGSMLEGSSLFAGLDRPDLDAMSEQLQSSIDHPWLLAALPFELSLDQMAGDVAAGLVLTSFSMRSVHRLRAAAILSNVGFIYYGIAVGAAPIWILHTILLPLNCWRLAQLRRPAVSGVSRSMPTGTSAAPGRRAAGPPAPAAVRTAPPTAPGQAGPFSEQAPACGSA